VIKKFLFGIALLNLFICPSIICEKSFLQSNILSPAKIALGSLGTGLALTEFATGCTTLYIASTMRSMKAHTLKDAIISSIKLYEQGSGVISTIKDRGITFIIDKVWKKYPITHAQLKTAGIASFTLLLPTIALSLWAVKSGVQGLAQDSQEESKSHAHK
jgi:hypothetical protein